MCSAPQAPAHGPSAGQCEQVTPLRAAATALGVVAVALATPAQAAPYRVVFGSYTGSLAAGSGGEANAGCLMCVSFTARSGERSARVYVQDRSGLPVPFVIRGSSRAPACTQTTIPVTPGATYTVVPYAGSTLRCAGLATTGTVTVMLRR